MKKLARQVLVGVVLLATAYGQTPADPASEITSAIRGRDFERALKLAETVTHDANSISDVQFAELSGFYSEGEIVELLCAIGLFNYFNRFNDALRMEPTKPGEGGCAAPAAEAASR